MAHVRPVELSQAPANTGEHVLALWLVLWIVIVAATAVIAAISVSHEFGDGWLRLAAGHLAQLFPTYHP